MPGIHLGASIGVICFLCFASIKSPIFWDWISKDSILNVAYYERNVTTNKPIMCIATDLDTEAISVYIKQSRELTYNQKTSLLSIVDTLVYNKDEFMLSQVNYIAMVKSGMEVLSIALNKDKQWVMFIDINKYDEMCSLWTIRLSLVLIVLAVCQFVW